jgi:alpha/beta superfamily hydrolase
MATTAPLRLTTEDGIELDAEVREARDPWAAAVLCHPHPLYGGNMRAGLIAILFDALATEGVSVLRFDFRGVGRSAGGHDGGRAEQHDVVAAVDAMAEMHPVRPLITAGWSFGGDVSLATACEPCAGWFAVAPPLSVSDPATMAAAGDERPALLAVPEHDEFRPPGEARSLVGAWPSTEVVTVPGADHLCTGRSGVVTDLLVGFLERLGRA